MLESSSGWLHAVVACTVVACILYCKLFTFTLAFTLHCYESVLVRFSMLWFLPVTVL